MRRCCAELAQYDAAITELRAMPDAASDREIQIRIAEVQQKAKRFADERKTLDRAEACLPPTSENRRSRSCAATCYEGEKNFELRKNSFRN